MTGMHGKVRNALVGPRNSLIQLLNEELVCRIRVVEVKMVAGVRDTNSLRLVISGFDKAFDALVPASLVHPVVVAVYIIISELPGTT